MKLIVEPKIQKQKGAWCLVLLMLMAIPVAINAQILASKQQPVTVAKPNIITLITDEWGYYELSSMGNKYLQTPRIDQLAKEGMRFTQALAGGALCAPTRNVLQTGQHMGHSTVVANSGANSLTPQDVTTPMVLKKAGYVTGGFGKWGLGDEGSVGVPENKGFDMFYGYYNQVHAHTYFPKYLMRNGKQEILPGNEKINGEKGNAWGNYYVGETFSHDLIFNEAMQWLTANKDTTFYLYLPFTVPHGLFGMPEDHPFYLRYKDKPWRAGTDRDTDSRVYAAMVEMFDAQIGYIVDSLKAWGIDQNTMIYIAGDNGANVKFKKDFATGQNNAYPDGFFSPNVDSRTGVGFRGDKGQIYEGGLRVPGIAWWPGKIKPGQVSDHLCFFGDLLPTYAEMAGLHKPEKIDGISLLPTLIGEEAAGRKQEQHEYLYWSIESGMQAVRMRNWKLMIKPAGGVELYDLSKDISESNDIANLNPGIVQQMRQYADNAKKPL